LTYQIVLVPVEETQLNQFHTLLVLKVQFTVLKAEAAGLYAVVRTVAASKVAASVVSARLALVGSPYHYQS
jgi:hypothetical protein